MKTLVRNRFQSFSFTGAMGVVTDTRYVMCFWPRLDRPTELFAPGSSGIEVMGPPTPRNVVFPVGTVMLTCKPDARYPAEQAVMAQRKPGQAFINLTPQEGDLWWASYQEAVAALPATAVDNETRDDVLLLRERSAGRDYIALLTRKETDDMLAGRVSEEQLRAAKTFVAVDDGATVLTRAL